jgi:hypothetical protein
MSSLSPKDRVSLCPRRCKTQNRPHRRLPGPNPHAGHPPLQARIHQRLRHRRLAQIRPQLRQWHHDYLFPPDPQPEQPASPRPQPQPQPRHQTQPAKPQTEAQQPAPASQPVPPPHTSLPPTSAEFVQHVLAGLQTGSLPATPHVQPAPPNPQPAETPVHCHSERSEEPAFSSSPAPSVTSAHTPQTPASPAHPDNPPRTGPPNRDPHVIHFDQNYRLRIDGKPF